MQAALQNVFKLLVKAAASPGGKRPSRDAAGSVLAAAVSALPLHGGWGCSGRVSTVRHQVLRQVVYMLFHGPMPMDCAGSFKALGACWAAHSCEAQDSHKLVRSTILSILRVLRGSQPWVV
jgi:hypothetical protein